MKNLQNNFTTPEQSKRLLSLGLPAETADCVLENLPCWSVGRMIEIILNCKIDTYELGFMLDKDTFNIESLIDIIDEDIKEFNFSRY